MVAPEPQAEQVLSAPRRVSLASTIETKRLTSALSNVGRKVHDESPDQAEEGDVADEDSCERERNERRGRSVSQDCQEEAALSHTHRRSTREAF